MEEFNKVIELTKDARVQLADDFRKELHKTLQLGQSRWVCRHGTLGDGHEKVTSAQRYFQAIREIYYLGSNIRQQKALAMLAQADLLDAEKEKNDASSLSQSMRAEGKMLQAREKLLNSLVTVEDQMRQIDEYNRVRLELKDEVEAKYPNGIEDAEEDNWRAVYKYRMFKSQGGVREPLSNIPLSPMAKAQLGREYGRIDSMAALAVSDEQKVLELWQDFLASLPQNTNVASKQIGAK